MKIVFPEFNHPTIQAAISATGVSALPAPDLTTACSLVKSGGADALIAGIDYSSRDVILACREHFGMAPYPQLVQHIQVQLDSTSDIFPTSDTYSTFSGLAVLQKPTQSQNQPQSQNQVLQDLNQTQNQTFLLADMAACKHPTKNQLIDIILQTATSAEKILSEPPRIALLSFSTNGSGGHDPSIDLIHSILEAFQGTNLLIDGEMQLDTALCPDVAAKKFPNSQVAGHANVLITPDLNSGNLLYKAFERLAGYTAAGPLLQGFNFPVSDLSRGSTLPDVILTIRCLERLCPA